MVSFSSIDIIILCAFFALVLLAGFFPFKRKKSGAEEYLLSGRKVGLFLFVLTNVATWYGGILGVGEFTYNYGILSWVTQGLPYYVFALLFAVFFAKKIRETSLYTIPDKIESVYGRKAGILSALIVFILVSPAPYLLMMANLLSLIFGIGLLPSLIITIVISASYLFTGGYRSDLITDALEFFVMFIGFIIIFVAARANLGGLEYLSSNLPADHLSPTGGSSLTFIIVWFLIALWTFTDPGFHQRCYAAKSGKVASVGIIISIFFWFLFDFLTTSTGLYARASLPDLGNPVLSFPLLAERILGSGYKGLFYAALFATILSTLNSFLFISATTFGRDIVFKSKKGVDENIQVRYTRIGLLFASILSILLAYYIRSVVELWYLLGSICIPGIIILILTAYYDRFRVDNKFAVTELSAAVGASAVWFLIRPDFSAYYLLKDIEPMIVGLAAALLIHFIGVIRYRKLLSMREGEKD